MQSTLTPSTRMARSPTFATAHQDRGTGEAAVNALCGCVEVVGDTVDPTEPGYDDQTTDECELGWVAPPR